MDGDITTVNTSRPRFVAVIARAAHELRHILPLNSRAAMTGGTEPARAAVFKRDMSHGAIAGTVVGVVVAVLLLAFCLYPVVIHRIKRRRRAQRPKLDTEAAGVQGPPSGPVGPDPNSHRRLSSTDSFKQDGDLARGDFGDVQNKEFTWTSRDGGAPQPDGKFGPSRQFSTQTNDTFSQGQGEHSSDNRFSNDDEADPTPFPYYFENTPAATQDDNPGVLKGTSADYYSPSIPSEAFGMVTTEEPLESARTLSRGSSFKHNIKQMFRRPSGRENSLASVLSSEDRAASSQAYSGTELGQIITTGHPTDSPTELSPTATSMPPPPVPELAEPSEQESSVSPPQPTIQTPPQSPPSDRAFKASPSPPTFPAPGTVNPMDIMPASTESEVWHRTEHQLHASSYGSSPGPSSSSDAGEQEQFSTFTPPPTMALSPSDAVQTAQSSTPTNQNAVQGLQEADEIDVPMVDVHSHDHLSPSMIPDNGRHHSYTSDGSTQYHGPHSTGPSTENTPSTQFDSPSPGSMNSSEIRNSASPQPPGLASPRTGLYRCNEPGCSQVFDQPHKLK